MLNYEFGVWSHECILLDQSAIVLNIFTVFKNECFKTISLRKKANCQIIRIYFLRIQAIQKVAPI
jgi:hypothetical protein